jgi:hypothetical protein
MYRLIIEVVDNLCYVTPHRGDTATLIRMFVYKYVFQPLNEHQI